MSKANQLEGLEPRSAEICLEVFKHCTATEASFISMAISMKRIADAMQEPNEYGEIGGAAISRAILRGLRDGR